MSMSLMGFVAPFVAIFVSLVAFVLYFYTRIQEKRIWNKGVCSKTRQPGRLYNVAIHGTRGYTDGLGNYCWIFTSVDKQSKPKKLNKKET